MNLSLASMSCSFLVVNLIYLSKYICLVLPVPGVELVPGLYELFLLGRDLEYGTYIFFGVTCPWRWACLWPHSTSCSFLILSIFSLVLPVVPSLYGLFLFGRDSEYIIFSLVLPVPGVELVPGLYELFLLGRDLEFQPLLVCLRLLQPLLQARDLQSKKLCFLYIFWRARVCWPRLCLCRPFCIFGSCLESNPESCRSKQVRCQLSHPSLLT